MWFLAVIWWVGVGSGLGSDVAVAGGCAAAKLKCAYRVGCGVALTQYLMWCSDVTRGVSRCPESCQHALIALTSTDEGKNLMNCECGDEYCQETKQRVEICRSQVMKAAQNETVSCRVSQLICAADAECSTALHYYRQLCRSMFVGKKCSHRCLNSIGILRKQEKAAKLSTCKCDGFEDYDCPKVQNNMARLCFPNKKRNHEVEDAAKPSTVDSVNSELATNQINSASHLSVSVLWTLINVFLVTCYSSTLYNYN